MQAWVKFIFNIYHEHGGYLSLSLSFKCKRNHTGRRSMQTFWRGLRHDEHIFSPSTLYFLFSAFNRFHYFSANPSLAVTVLTSCAPTSCQRAISNRRMCHRPPTSNPPRPAQVDMICFCMKFFFSTVTIHISLINQVRFTGSDKSRSTGQMLEQIWSLMEPLPPKADASPVEEGLWRITMHSSHSCHFIAFCTCT